MTPEERFSWLQLARTETIGPVTFAALLSRYGSAKNALAALPDLAHRSGRPGFQPASVDKVAAEIRAGEAQRARLLLGCDLGFPKCLAALDPPPPLIWVKGDATLLARDGVAVVGARNASAAGMRFARQLALDLGQTGLSIVSGMARGIDAAAHDGAMMSGTIAVLGGGIDDIYPSEHADLHARIGAQGCLVSESPPGKIAQARDFPRRNRIIAGLARAVVVVEAELKSGSLITARLAGEAGRDVLAVPGSPLDPRSKGTNDLLRQGAHLCEGADDVLNLLSSLPGLREPARRSAQAIAPAEFHPPAALRAQLAALLSPVPVSQDSLIRASGAPAAEVMATLLELCLTEDAELLPGGLVVKR